MFASLDFSLSISLSRLSALLSHAAKINKIVFIRLFAIWLDANGSSGFENVSHDKNDEVEITFQFVFKSIFFFSSQFPFIVVASKRNDELKGKNYVTIRRTMECSGEKGLSIHIPTQKSRCLGLYILKFSFSDSLASFFA